MGGRSAMNEAVIKQLCSKWFTATQKQVSVLHYVYTK